MSPAVKVVLFLVDGVALVMVGYTFARWREARRKLRELRVGDKRAQIIMRKAREQGWLDLAEFRELVNVWPGYADLVFLVRRPLPDVPPTIMREGRPN